MTTLDQVIWRRDLQAHLNVSRETMRLWIKNKKLPPLDISITPKQQGWNRSSLVAAGFKLPEAS